MDLNTLMWLLAACRIGGRSRVPMSPGGEVGPDTERQQSGKGEVVQTPVGR